MRGSSLPDQSLDGFSKPTADKSKCITLQRCEKCGAYTNEPGACCRQPIGLLPPAVPLLMPQSPLGCDFNDDDMWGHLLGGEG
jgi:hypothetical protein